MEGEASASSAVDSDHPPATKKRRNEEKRRFLPAWKTEYPWVYRENNKLFCRYCVESKKHNAFTSGCPQFKKDALKKHVGTVDHRAAVEAKTGRKDMQVAVATAHKRQERSVIAALQLVYFMAKKHLPSDSFSDLKHLLILQVRFRCGLLHYIL